jgi:DNA polymerase-3 subunit epsilon
MGSLSRLVVLDTETTGLKPEDGHRVIEVGCIELLGRRPSGRRLHFYLNPERAIDEAAIQVHGLTLERLANEPVFAEIAQELFTFLKGAQLVIHNAPFDVGFLNAEFSRLDLPTLQSRPDITIVDSLEMARQLHPGQRNSLDALCTRYNVSNSHRQLHGALLDAELLAEVYLGMTRGQEALAMSASDDDLDLPEASDPALLSRLRVVTPTPQELADHEDYLQSLQKTCRLGAVWTRPAAT